MVKSDIKLSNSKADVALSLLNGLVLLSSANPCKSRIFLYKCSTTSAGNLFLCNYMQNKLFKPAIAHVVATSCEPLLATCLFKHPAAIEKNNHFYGVLYCKSNIAEHCCGLENQKPFA